MPDSPYICEIVSMISITDLSMLFGDRLLFGEVSINFTAPNRYGLVGANGTGKSTFLRLLAGEEQPSLGDVTVSNRAKVGWLKQDQYKYEHSTVVETVLQGKPKLWEALQEKENIFSQMAHSPLDEKSGYRLATLEEVILHNDGYTAETFAQDLLTGLGVPAEYHYKPLATLSGGYKLRVLLAQALFEEPDILLLDEPTNHLDIMSIAWLETYLKKFKGLLLFISHDYDFLNNLCTHVLDIDYGEIREYVGNYEFFLEEKKQVVERKMHEIKYIEKKIETMRSFIAKFGAKASKAKQAQSREKMLEKIELPDIKKSSRVSPNYNFTQNRPSGKMVLTVDKLAKQFKDRFVLKNVSFTVNRGEKVAIIGHNGIGKSTLLKVLLGQHVQDMGEYQWGHECHISYFAQDHHEQLKGNASVYDWLVNQNPKETTETARRVLGAMLFSKDDVHKAISVISGGEAARVLFASIMLQKNNVLVLDEPTNHLDLEAKESLAESLSHFPGTLLLVSHDRHFVSKIATRVLAFTEKGITDFHGPYTEYLTRYGDDYLSREWVAEKEKTK